MYKVNSVWKYCLFIQWSESNRPGQTVQMKIEFDYPVAIYDGLRFGITENGKVIGVGAVTVIVN